MSEWQTGSSRVRPFPQCPLEREFFYALPYVATGNPVSHSLTHRNCPREWMPCARCEVSPPILCALMRTDEITDAELLARRGT